MHAKHQNKKKKNVLLISSTHHDDKTEQDTDDEKKPEIIIVYNAITGDVVEMMTDENSISRNSRCWSPTMFCALLSMSCVNSYILYVHNPQNKPKHHNVTMEVGLVPLEENIRRLQNNRLAKSIRAGIARMMPEAAVETSS